MRELKFICAQPDDLYFKFQVHTWIESLRELGLSDKACILLFTPGDRQRSTRWDDLIAEYPEADWFFHPDTDNISRFLPTYIPVLRPYILSKYFKLHPELKDKAIFYCDCDIVFTKDFKIDHLLDDDICYVSNTLSYINADYFARKYNDCIPAKSEQLKKRDILEETCKLVGIPKEIAVKNNANSGGAQYLLKGIDDLFWNKVIYDCLVIIKHLRNVNREFFESENKGFQSWCADMWAVLWNLWLFGKDTKIVPEMDFAWSTDPISKLDKVGILHNAGIVSDFHGETPVFCKNKFINSPSPFDDPHLQVVLNSDKNKEICNSYYTKVMVDTYNKYKLKY